MTFRYWTTLALAVGLAACSGTKGTTDAATPTTDGNTDGNPGDDDDTTDTQTSPGTESGDSGSTSDTDTPPTTDTQTTDTYVTPTHETGFTFDTGGTSTSSFLPKNVVISASLVIDGPNGVLTTATDPNSTATLTSFIAIEFGDDAWKNAGEDPTLTDDYCVFLMPLTNSTQATWLPSGSYFGVDYDGGELGAQTNCGDATHPMDALFPGYATTTGGGTTATTTAQGIVEIFGPWGAGIGPANGLVDGATVSGTNLIGIGGLINNAGFFDPTGSPGLPADIDAFNHYVAIPFAIDAGFALEYDTFGNPVLVAPADVFDGTNVASGVYNIFDFFIWSFNL